MFQKGRHFFDLVKDVRLSNELMPQSRVVLENDEDSFYEHNCLSLIKQTVFAFIKCCVPSSGTDN
jgi:hypothetical protein